MPGMLSFFTFSGQMHLYKRAYWLGCFALLACSCLFFASLSAHSAAVKHGCAPNTPPNVSGTPVTTAATQGALLINELLSQPHSTWNCSEPQGTYSQSMDSWIELYNPQDYLIDLYADRAKLSLDGGSSWYYLPLGAEIAPRGFLVVFPEEGLSSAPTTWSTVQLAFANTLIDQVNVPQLSPDQAYARVPDGSKHWQIVDLPTIDASNNPSQQSNLPTPTRQTTPIRRTTPTTTDSGTSTNNPISNGTEPAWQQIQLPPIARPVRETPTVLPTLPLKQAPINGENAPDAQLIALITALSLLLLGVLIWCWRLFRTS